MSTGNESKVWSEGFKAPGNPAGFSLRTTVPGNAEGVEVMLEQWEAGSSEPPHSHPGDDMTVVVEGRMEVQFFTQLLPSSTHPIRSQLHQLVHQALID